MKTLGVVLVILAAWFLSNVWYDPVEGKFARPVAYLGIAAGTVIFFLGIRNDIIAAILKRRDDKPGK